MKKIFLFSCSSLLFLFFFASLSSTLAATATTFQVTTDGSQQKDAFVYDDLIAYNSLSDIWGYSLETQQNAPIIQKDGQQYITHLYKNLIVYQDIPADSPFGDIRLYNLKTGEDSLVVGDPNEYSSGGTNGKVVVYLEGGACGSLYAYDLHKHTTQHIIDTVCTPKISNNIVYWGEGALGGSNIRGYDLKRKQFLDLAVEDGFQESAHIFGNDIVWYQYDSGNYGTHQAIVVKNLKTGERKVVYETNTHSLQSPSVSDRFIIWSESPQPHVNGIKGFDRKTGEIFTVQDPASNQNTHTVTSLWKDTAAWGSTRTGNGDIYGAILNK